MTRKRNLIFVVTRSALAILIALGFAAVLIFISSNEPTFADRIDATGDALKQMLVGPLFRLSTQSITFDVKRLTDVLSAMVPTIFAGLAVCVMFSAQQFNLGAEGGVMLGGFTAALVAVYIPICAVLHPIVAVLAAGVITAAVMLIPALLKAKLNVSEMVCSLMLNYIIMYIIKFLLNSYLADRSKGQVQTYEFQATARIPLLTENGSKLSIGFLIALGFVVLCGLFLYRTRHGYSIRMIGINQSFAQYSGISVAGVIVMSQLLGGFLAGVGGGIEVLGRYTSFNWKSLPGYGWTGVTIAILAGNNPWYVPLAAFFMAYLTKGCDMMATYAGVPSQLIDLIQGVIFLFFSAEKFLSHFKQRLVVRTAQEEQSRQKIGGGERA